MDIRQFIERFAFLFNDLQNKMPWEITNNLAEILVERMTRLDKEYTVNNDVAIHRSAVIEQNVVLKGPIIIGKNCFIGANAYMRGPIFLDENVNVGAGCEIKQSIIFSYSAIAHFNYVGNSIVGSNVNFEAGSVAANHFNERKDKTISVLHDGNIINTHSQKFGSLVGDYSRVGANAVLSPGTILPKHSIVKRLELIEQVK